MVKTEEFVGSTLVSDEWLFGWLFPMKLSASPTDFLLLLVACENLAVFLGCEFQVVVTSF